MNNAEFLIVPSHVEVVPKELTDALLVRLRERMKELKAEGWKPSSGWASDTNTDRETAAHG